MSNIDERVVVLTFDNSQFEENTKQSVASLKNLDSTIKNSSSGEGLKNIGKAANKIDLSKLSNSVDTVNSRFSTMGIVGMSAIASITNSVVHLGAKLISAVPTQIVKGGITRALNIEQAKFQIEGLGGVWDNTSKNFKAGVTTMKDSVNAAVDSTAYGLDEAAKIASQLMASGLTDTNEMTNALKGVAGVAAMTGSGYSDIGRIFAQVAGQGRLMGDQLLQLSQRGINVAATLAKQLHTSEAHVREMVSKGKISFTTFYKAMNNAFGAHAKEANNTFTGSLANMKAALSRIGAEAASPALVNLRNIMNALTPVINSVHKAMLPMVTVMNNAQTAMGNLISKGLINLNNHLLPIATAAETAANSMKKTIAMSFTEMQQLAAAGAKANASLVDSSKDVVGQNGRQIRSFNPLVMVFSSLLNVIRAVKNALSSFITVIKSVAKFLKAIIFPAFSLVTGGVYSLSSKILELSERLKEFVEKHAERFNAVIRTKITPAVTKKKKKIGSLLVRLKDWIVKSPVIYHLLIMAKDALILLGRGFVYVTKHISSFFKAIANSKGVKELESALGKLWEAIKPIISSKIDAFAKKISSIFTSAGKGVSVLDKLVGGISKLSGWISRVITQIASGVNPFNKFSSVASKIKDKVVNFKVVDTVNASTSSTGDALGAAGDKAKKATGFFGSFFDILRKGVSYISGKFNDVFGNGNIQKFFKNIGNALAGIDVDKLINLMYYM